MQRAVLVMLIFGLFGVRAEVMAAQCSSYYISEINLVSTDDAEAGHVQTLLDLDRQRKRQRRGPWGRVRVSDLTLRRA